MENKELFHIALENAPNILEKVDTKGQVDSVLDYIKKIAEIKWADYPQRLP